MTPEKIAAFVTQIQPIVLGFALQVAIAIAIFLIGRFSARWAKHLLKTVRLRARSCL